MKNALQAAAWTGLAAFIGIVAPASLGWLGDVQQWADGSIDTFPSVTPLAKVSVGAVAAGVAGAVTAGLVWLRGRSWFPGTPPAYGPVSPDAARNLEG